MADAPERAKAEWENIKLRLAEGDDHDDEYRDRKHDTPIRRYGGKRLEIMKLTNANENNNADDDKMMRRGKRRHIKAASEKSRRSAVIDGMIPLF